MKKYKNTCKKPMAAKTTKQKKSSKTRSKDRKMAIDYKEIKNVKKAAFLGAILALVIILCNVIDFSTSDKTADCYCDCATAPISTKERFYDINPEQLAHAKANGIESPIKDMTDWEMRKKEMLKKKQLVLVRHNRYYNIRPLTHSIPYLTPEAKELLNEIGLRFQKNLKAAGLPRYKFQISSLTRTIEFQKQLTRTNINATPNETCHYFGTTFDIAYDKYDRRKKTVQDANVEAILTKTLRQMRSECRLMIIKESSNKCYHITVVQKHSIAKIPKETKN